MFLMRALPPSALILGLACLTSPVGAESSGDENVSRSSTMQGLVEDLSGQIGRLIADLPRSRLDLVVVTSGRSGATARFRQTFQEILLAELSRGQSLRSVQAQSGSDWADRPGARSSASSQGFELLLWLEVSIDTNHLAIEGMVFETEHHLWRQTVSPERQTLGQVFVRTRVNAEIRHYLTPLNMGVLSINPVPLGHRRYLAMAVADVDGDDLTELIMLSDRALEIRSLRQGQANVVAQLKLAGLPRAATRSRDPIGMVVVGPPEADGLRKMALRTSDYSRGIIVRYDGVELQLQGTVTDFPMQWETELECTTMTPGRNTFGTAATPCGSLEETPSVPPFSAAARESIPRPGAQEAVAAARVLADGSVSLSWNDAVVARVSSYGTALAISDIDDDGVAEILLSSDRDPGRGDELTVLRLSQEGLVAGRERLGDISGSVWVAGAGDADNDGLRELLAVSQTSRGAELLVIE